MAVLIQLPPQRKRFREKNKEWRELCVNSIDGGISYLRNQEVRNSIKEKVVNGRLYDGILDMTDVLDTISTEGILKSYVPKKIQNRPVLRPYIELLVGEATKEPFEWSVMVTDPSSISEKQENKKKALNEKLSVLLESKYEGEELRAKFKELELFFRYSYKDLKEVKATKLLNYYYQLLKMPDKFIEAMLDGLVYGERIMMFDIVAGSVVANKLDPKRVHTLYSSNSNKISDADVIIIEEYWSKGKIIDNYWDELTPAEIDEINGFHFMQDSRYTETLQNIIQPQALVMDASIAAAMQNGFSSNSRSAIDMNGNIRHLTALWRSQKLVKIVKGINPETGEQYEKVMSEEYIPNEATGEKAEKVWIEEWWEGRKIGNNMFKKIRPRPIQFTSMHNISKGHPGVVGIVNSISEGKVVSFLSKIKPLQYSYNIVWDRLMEGIRKNLGKILEVDMAKIPKDWTVDKWLMYAYKGGIAFVDSFKEATKGAAIGKLAGTFNTTNRTIDVDTGNYIQQQINLLEFIMTEIRETVGITPQRQGAVQASAAVGATERSVMASNNNTAYEFHIHEQFKLECMQVLLETAKVALRGNKKVAQNILSDYSTEALFIEEDDLIDSDHAVFLTTSKKSREIKQSLDMFSQAYMQNGGKLSTVMDIIFSDSLAEKRRKIEMAEFDTEQQAQAAAERQAQLEQEKTQTMAADKEAERNLKMYEIDTNNATKIILEEMKLVSADKKMDMDAAKSKEEILTRIQEMQAKIDLEYKKAKMAENKREKSAA